MFPESGRVLVVTKVNNNGDEVLVAGVHIGESKDKLVESLLGNRHVRICLLGADVASMVVVCAWRAADIDSSLSNLVLILVVDINGDDNLLGIAVAALHHLDEVVAKLLITPVRLVELSVHGTLELVVAIENIVTVMLIASVWV